MIRPTEQIILDFDQFDPIRDGWPKLDSLVAEMKASPKPGFGIDALLGVFERYPGTSTAGGTLMTVLHTLETIPGFETHLVGSMGRRPSVLAVMILNRLLNSGILQIGSESVIDVLKKAHAKPRTERIVKTEIEAVLKDRF